ncbi:hypothetical protein EMIHUDRAFT_374551 [Emiliania huxleyi CCMP1516]|uniref:Uncharacterized protein n=2 Tax=Emiliania huxleyi TaxID=2903 RepID=A0A0D3I1E5_EMIH1|nr:hypothetical protein EMIHUDRAFT_374551 [Emiliania huxleyi CCMP1516]EOD05080.1 hypothetical protein EMIHUDRAFT_374551 [Emiliania huxleyi CCMP1516]|mmetsp:Transcript_9726/g.28972  ORF Transcript_9726/g.28972 Transcript_9726/m.28972 type:complete len:80 (+) Transcript_9726:7-246(+)|eukprot:XP_005757509.1 hypothetical protein EMIHUDRAFT_374551 [Emiliania huxleyi CCMP1516]
MAAAAAAKPPAPPPSAPKAPVVDASLYEVEGAASLDEAGYRRALERKLLLQKLERYKQLGDEHGVQATEGYLAWFDGQQ